MRYIVYGLGISGVSTAKFLERNGENVTVTDESEATLNEAKKLFEKTKIKICKPDEIEYDSRTIISFSPGIPLYFPKPHKILEITKKTGADLACDIEIFYRKNNQDNFIAITGTNGKSTTTALTGFIFEKLKIPSAIGGNIGTPCFELKKQTSAKYSFIFETSSYQLDLLSQAHFGIAALLNITPDHIDRHGSMSGYIEAKKRIFRNQTEQDFALIDADNENSKQVLEENLSPATTVPISTKSLQKNGVSLFNDILTNQIGGRFSQLNLKSEFLRGEHNDQNMAFAFAITYCHLLKHKIEIDEIKIIEAIKEFKGLRHRMQILGKIDGIKFINDSKATNAESTENALKTYDNVFWILGGKAKEGGISSLTPYFKKVHKAYLIGEASENFAEVLKNNSVAFEKCGDLEPAFKRAFSDAKTVGLSEKNILLSPACASFDQWKNFEQRGDYFCKLFDDLLSKS